MNTYIYIYIYGYLYISRSPSHKLEVLERKSERDTTWRRRISFPFVALCVLLLLRLALLVN